MHLLLIAEIPGPQGVRYACRIQHHPQTYTYTETEKNCGDGEEDKIMRWFETVYFADQQLILKSRGSQF